MPEEAVFGLADFSHPAVAAGAAGTQEEVSVAAAGISAAAELRGIGEIDCRFRIADCGIKKEWKRISSSELKFRNKD